MADDPRDKLTDWRPAGTCLFSDSTWTYLTTLTDADNAWIAYRLNLAAQQAERIEQLERSAAYIGQMEIALQGFRNHNGELKARIATLEAERDAALTTAEEERQNTAAAWGPIEQAFDALEAAGITVTDSVAADVRTLISERDQAIAAQALAVECAEAARVDQARYRRLRGRLIVMEGRIATPTGATRFTPEETDASIDAALQQEGAQPGGSGKPDVLATLHWYATATASALDDDGGRRAKEALGMEASDGC